MEFTTQKLSAMWFNSTYGTNEKIARFWIDSCFTSNWCQCPAFAKGAAASGTHRDVGTPLKLGGGTNHWRIQPFALGVWPHQANLPQIRVSPRILATLFWKCTKNKKVLTFFLKKKRYSDPTFWLNPRPCTPIFITRTCRGGGRCDPHARIEPKGRRA